MVKRLHDRTGISYAAIYADLGDHFHVGTYRDIPDARWSEVSAWFQQRIDAGEKRRAH